MTSSSLLSTTAVVVLLALGGCMRYGYQPGASTSEQDGGVWADTSAGTNEVYFVRLGAKGTTVGAVQRVSP